MKEKANKYFEELAKNLFLIVATNSENKNKDFNQAICHSIIDPIIEIKKLNQEPNV